MGWLYNNVFYSSTADFRAAWETEGFEKIDINYDSVDYFTDRVGTPFLEDAKAPPISIQVSSYELDSMNSLRKADPSLYLSLSLSLSLSPFSPKVSDSVSTSLSDSSSGKVRPFPSTYFSEHGTNIFFPLPDFSFFISFTKVSSSPSSLVSNSRC